MNIIDKRNLLDRSLNLGQFAFVSFGKKDGSIREATIKKFVEDGFVSGDRNVVQENTVAHKPEYYTAYDVSNKKWININLSNLIKAKVQGQEINFQ